MDIQRLILEDEVRSIERMIQATGRSGGPGMVSKARGAFRKTPGSCGQRRKWQKQQGPLVSLGVTYRWGKGKKGGKKRNKKTMRNNSGLSGGRMKDEG
jgi:hypothetical protein